MATTYENMVLKETHHREKASQIEWGRQHASEASVFPLESQQFAKLSSLRNQVADLCDLQPTPVSMPRPARKDALKTLRGELAAVLGDVEAELDQLGGSASTVSARTHTTAKSTAKSFKSMAASVAASVPRSIAEE